MTRTRRLTEVGTSDTSSAASAARWVLAIAVAACGWAAGCATPEGGAESDAGPQPGADSSERGDAGPIEATSLLGEPLRRTELPGGTREEFEQRLAAAQADLEADPASPEALIWVGRRTAYLGRYQEAIDVFSRGVERFPEDPRFYRHRGHRYLTTRQFEQAEADFERAVELIGGQEDQIEPDGIPNDRGVPTSSLHSNIWYHLGLVRYLQGDFEGAIEAYHECLQALDNTDHQVATRYWTYLTLRRLERDEDAAGVLAFVTPELEVFENQTYHRLLLFYRGDLSEEELLGEGAEALDLATTGYGVGAWHLVEGDESAARERFEQVLDTPQWAAFGYIAAEAEMVRLTAE